MNKPYINFGASYPAAKVQYVKLKSNSSDEIKKHDVH